jgi:hypothetical protein
MKLLDLLVACLIILILASCLLTTINKVYHKAQWYLFVSNAWNNSRIEAAMIDADDRFDQLRLEMLLSHSPTFK